MSTITLLSPLTGPLLNLESVPDPVFSALMAGDGIAIDPISDNLLAPCDGEVIQLAKTHHAVTIETSTGVQVLMHIGIDTVMMKGEGFIPLVSVGDKVTCGQPLIAFDLNLVASKAPSLNTMITIINGDEFVLGARSQGMAHAGVTALFSVSSKSDNGNQVVSNSNETFSATATIKHHGGIHARPAALIQNTAKPYSGQAKISIEYQGKTANAASMVSLLGLGVPEHASVNVSAIGNQAQQAVQAVIAALETVTTLEAVTQPEVKAVRPVNGDDSLIYGVCAAPGLAIGQVVRLGQTDPAVEELAADVTTENNTLLAALQTVKNNLQNTIDEAKAQHRSTEVAIFSAHLALLEDPELSDYAGQLIQQGKSAGFAWKTAVESQMAILSSMGSELLKERVADLRDLKRQVLQVIVGETAAQIALYEHSILVADDLTPSDLTSLPPAKVAGFISAQGGATAHVAILARAMGIPALVAAGSKALTLEQGQTILLDSTQNWANPTPSEDVLSQAKIQLKTQALEQAEMSKLADQPAISLDGKHIEIAANIANEVDAKNAYEKGADSIGLLRSEFLFIDRSTAPTEEEQRVAYQAVIDAMQGKSAIIRTIDVGGDKEVPYLQLPEEPNPALGLRGVRTSFAYPEMLDAQLAALLQVKPLSLCRILVPMISDVAEVIQFKERLETLAQGLGLTERPQLGVMIEVPSAALLAEQLAPHIDFMSIGTNDLTQYTMAMDRCNNQLAHRVDAMHPAVLHMIKLTCEGAAKHGRWVGMCGTLASDPDATPILLGLGLTELSVSTPLIPQIKARVRTLSVTECQEKISAVLALTSAQAVRDYAKMHWG